MPKGFGIGGWGFIKQDDDNSESGRYNITDKHGQHYDYDHEFSSVDEMKDYVKEHSRTVKYSNDDDENNEDDD